MNTSLNTSLGRLPRQTGTACEPREPHRFARWWRGLGTVVVGVLLTACAAPPPADPGLLELDEAVHKMADGLAEQATSNPLVMLARLADRSEKRIVLIDPLIDGRSGQRTVLSSDVERRVAARLLSTRKDFQVSPLQSEPLKQAEFLLLGTVGPEQVDKAEKSDKLGNAGRAPIEVDLVMVAAKSGTVVAKAKARVRNNNFDLTPSTFDQDSPVVALDRSVRGYVATVGSVAGAKADPDYWKQLSASAAIVHGTDSYNRGKYAEALKEFQTALSDPAGEQLRALNGSYLASVKLGKLDQAEAFFGRIVALGLRDRNLGIKFLFNPNSTEFWSDPKVSGMYDMWVRQVTRAIERSTICVDVVGHASRTGAESANEKLSESRAAMVRQKMLGAAAKPLANRVGLKAMGSKEYLVPIATDDARDAVNRRVAFNFKDCS